MAFETSKNYNTRITNGDFDKYLNGNGIDIGGGPDCLKLQPGIEGYVELYDFADGDAQYLHGIKDNSFDFVYSSHCLEHMRDIDCAFLNWLRVCKKGGYAYICVPHEIYYEKSIWPSRFNSDHKWSFTISERTDLPHNVSIIEFLDRYKNYVDVIDIRENLLNYDFECDQSIDQTLRVEDGVCAQIDFIVRKKSDIIISRSMDHYWKDYFTYYIPIRARHAIKIILKRVLPTGVIKTIKRVRGV